MAWNNGEPIRESKKSHQGMNIRLSLLTAHFGETAASLVRKRHPAGQVADDDIYDAFAALWTAEHILLETAKSIPDQPEIDPSDCRWRCGISYCGQLATRWSGPGWRSSQHRN